MIDAPLSACLAGDHGLEELGLTLREVAGPARRVATVAKLARDVYRIVLGTPHQPMSVVAKRLTPTVAHRNQLALQKWLPAAGMEHTAAALLGVAAERTGSRVWHVYEDLGESTLAQSSRDPAIREAAIELIASIHVCFAHNPILAECRVWGEDHGIGFYDASVRDAIAAVTAALSRCEPSSHEAAAARRLLERLDRLWAQRDDRLRVLHELGGPETLLHGDLWLKNAAVLRGAEGHRVRLIDWDKTGPGSFSYDLSTLVMRFPPDLRGDVIDMYRRALAERDISLPSEEDMRTLFSTAECARLANVAIWTAHCAAESNSRWAFEELAAIDDWFERVEPRCAV